MVYFRPARGQSRIRDCQASRSASFFVVCNAKSERHRRTKKNLQTLAQFHRTVQDRIRNSYLWSRMVVKVLGL